MKKVIKEVGGESLGVRFTKEESKIYGIKKDDIIDLEFVIVDENLSNILAKQKQSESIKKIREMIK